MTNKTLFKAIKEHQPLIILGAVNAYCGMMAERLGARALYISGAGVANASYGLPDLGMTTLNDVLEDLRRLSSATTSPILVDIDTGWGGAFNIARTIKEMIKSGAAAVHIEDQVAQKRCGHRPNKAMVSTEEMIDRIKAAVDAKTDSNFFIMARTDAFASEDMQGALERCEKYLEAGADGIFAEAMTDIKNYTHLKQKLQCPLLANITEFGETPLYSQSELGEAGVDMVLYPLSAFRAMNRAAEKVYKSILNDGTQQNVLDTMQTRNELYEYLDYLAYEEQLDKLFS